MPTYKVSRLSSETVLRLGAVAHACNPSYVGGRDWQDHGLKSARAKSSSQTGYGDMPLSFQLLEKHK
jgi:hypothetical protein